MLDTIPGPNNPAHSEFQAYNLPWWQNYHKPYQSKSFFLPGWFWFLELRYQLNYRFSNKTPAGWPRSVPADCQVLTHLLFKALTSRLRPPTSFNTLTSCLVAGWLLSAFFFMLHSTHCWFSLSIFAKILSRTVSSVSARGWSAFGRG